MNYEVELYSGERNSLSREVYDRFAQDLAAALDWEIESVDNSLRRNADYKYLIKGEYSLSIYLPTFPKDPKNPKVDIAARLWLGNEPAANYLYGSDTADTKTTASIGIKKGVQKIAREIERRVFPDYFKLMGIAKDCKQQREAATRILEARTNSLGAVIGAKPANPEKGELRETLNLKGLDERLGVDALIGNSIDLRLQGLSQELAEEILKLVAQHTETGFERWKRKVIEQVNLLVYPNPLEVEEYFTDFEWFNFEALYNARRPYKRAAQECYEQLLEVLKTDQVA